MSSKDRSVYYNTTKQSVFSVDFVIIPAFLPYFRRSTTLILPPHLLHL